MNFLTLKGLIVIQVFRNYEKLYLSKTFLNWLLILLPESASGNKLRKPSKESGIFQSLGTINLVLFTKWLSQKGGGMAQSPLPLNTLLVRSNNSIVMN